MIPSCEAQVSSDCQFEIPRCGGIANFPWQWDIIWAGEESRPPWSPAGVSSTEENGNKNTRTMELNTMSPSSATHNQHSTSEPLEVFSMYIFKTKTNTRHKRQWNVLTPIPVSVHTWGDHWPWWCAWWPVTVSITAGPGLTLLTLSLTRGGSSQDNGGRPPH